MQTQTKVKDMKELEKFSCKLGAKINWPSNLIKIKGNRYYLIKSQLQKLSKTNFYHAGLYLGKEKSNRFFPSFSLLKIITKKSKNKIVVNKKASWLFICGRDIFSSGIIKISGSKKTGDLTLILNQYGECLGYGRMVDVTNEFEGSIAVKNILDLGDFLRRER